MRGLERGLDRALRRLNWGQSKALAYVEIEAFVIENLVQAMERGFLDPAPVWSNLKTFRPGILRGKIAGIVGGYPCQPFSLAGLQQGVDDPRHLWPYIADIIRADRPFFCWFENVANHLNIGYDIVRSELQEMGYHVEEGIYSASEAGAPHKRERLFILAILDYTHIPPTEYTVPAGWHTAPGTGELDDTSIERARELSVHPRGQEQSDADTHRAGEELGDSKNHNKRRSPEQIIERKGEQTGRSGGSMANTSSEGLQIGEDQQGLRQRSPDKRSGTQLADPNLWWQQQWLHAGVGRIEELDTLWPAGPGCEQNPWEHPRTLDEATESEMGIAVDGHNFREDLLRLAGNGVVEQTAEIAVLDLLNKHINYQQRIHHGNQTEDHITAR